MKKIFFLAMIIGMMITAPRAFAQKLDAVIDNGIGNIGQTNEFNYRIFSLDVCPIKIGDGQTLLGIYGQTDELYSKDDTKSLTFRSVQWNAGLSFNTKFGYNENWYLKLRAGYGQLTSRISQITNHKQVNNIMVGSLILANWQEDNNWFCRHSLIVKYRQPLSASKIMLDSLKPEIQLLQGKFTETPVSFFLDQDRDWKMNIDLAIGFKSGQENLLNQMTRNSSYWTVGGGISIFKIPYFQQNMLEFSGETHFMDNATIFVPSIKLNLVPLLFLIWDKEIIEVKLK